MNDYVVEPLGMISGQGEAQRATYRKVQGKSGKTWYIPVNEDGPAAGIQVDTHDPNSEGYGGTVLQFRLEDGTVDRVKGPWHSNSEALFRDTGIDLRDRHRTFVVLAKDRQTDEHHRTVLTGVIYQDPEGGLLGPFNRWKQLAEQYPEAECYYSESRSGSSYGPIKRKQ